MQKINPVKLVPDVLAKATLKQSIRIAKVEGPFELNGQQCEDGYVIIDGKGKPGIIEKAAFEKSVEMLEPMPVFRKDAKHPFDDMEKPPTVVSPDPTENDDESETNEKQPENEPQTASDPAVDQEDIEFPSDDDD